MIEGYKFPENPPEEIEIKIFSLFRQKFYLQNELYEIDIGLYDNEVQRELHRMELINSIKSIEVQITFENIKAVRCPF